MFFIKIWLAVFYDLMCLHTFPVDLRDCRLVETHWDIHSISESVPINFYLYLEPHYWLSFHVQVLQAVECWESGHCLVLVFLWRHEGALSWHTQEHVHVFPITSTGKISLTDQSALWLVQSNTWGKWSSGSSKCML